jgi:2-keto-4-pentenoate hydratase/2-oxohepta-3-ene-1,7-dioic acid hydratase in catechol pathway
MAAVDPADLALRSWVNGEPRQDSITADMIFNVFHLSGSSASS